MYPDLKDKVALVTGSGKKNGIGYAVAEKLAAGGTHVIIADMGRNPGAGGPVKTGSRSEMEDSAATLKERFDVC